MFKTNVTFDFDKVLCLCSKQWRDTISLSIWLLETGLSEFLFNGMLKVNNDLSRASTLVNFFNEKFYSRGAPRKGSRHLNHYLLIFPKEAFERVCSIWSDRCKMRHYSRQFGFILCSWWNQSQRFVYYLWKECRRLLMLLSYNSVFHDIRHFYWNMGYECWEEWLSITLMWLP